MPRASRCRPRPAHIPAYIRHAVWRARQTRALSVRCPAPRRKSAKRSVPQDSAHPAPGQIHTAAGRRHPCAAAPRHDGRCRATRPPNCDAPAPIRGRRARRAGTRTPPTVYGPSSDTRCRYCRYRARCPQYPQRRYAAPDTPYGRPAHRWPAQAARAPGPAPGKPREQVECRRRPPGRHTARPRHRPLAALRHRRPDARRACQDPIQDGWLPDGRPPDGRPPRPHLARRGRPKKQRKGRGKMST